MWVRVCFCQELLDYHYSQFLNLRDDMRYLAQHNFTAVRAPMPPGGARE